MIQSRIAGKAQTTIPAPARKALGLREGDVVAHRIQDGRVVMTPAESTDDAVAAFDAWDGPADRSGHADF